MVIVLDSEAWPAAHICMGRDVNDDDEYKAIYLLESNGLWKVRPKPMLQVTLLLSNLPQVTHCYMIIWKYVAAS